MRSAPSPALRRRGEGPGAGASFAQAQRSAAGLLIFRDILADSAGRAFLRLIEVLTHPDESARSSSSLLAAYADLFSALAADGWDEPSTGDAWQDHLIERILAAENPFSLQAQRLPLASLGPSLVEAARHDLLALQTLARLDAESLRSAVADRLAAGDGVQPIDLVSWRALPPSSPGVQSDPDRRRFLEAADWGALVDDLAGRYACRGVGWLTRYRAFRWLHAPAGHLVGIAEPDPIRLDQLIGYEPQRALLVRVTEQFLAGGPGNNVLLYGDRGTSKSSSVKALLNAYADRGLRLVEMHKDELADLPSLFQLVRGRPERFIVFVDDLSFDDTETRFKDLKALLEGGLEARPANVLLYATSNRRHLIQERFAAHPNQAAPGADEVRAGDTVQEKLSLSDRFGITIIFPTPDQEQFLQIVAGLAAQRSLPIPADQLRRQALHWAAWQNGRSGRTARQFVDHLVGTLLFSQANTETADRRS